MSEIGAAAATSAASTAATATPNTRRALRKTSQSRRKLTLLEEKNQAKRHKERQRFFVNEAAKDKIAASKRNNGKVPHGEMGQIMDRWARQAREEFHNVDFLDRNAIDYAARKMAKQNKNQTENDALTPQKENNGSTLAVQSPAPQTPVARPPRAKGGRPSRAKGGRPPRARGGRPPISRNKTLAEKETQQSILRAKEKVALQYAQAQRNLEPHQKTVPRGTLERLIKAAEHHFKIPKGSIPKRTIINRVARNNPTAFNKAAAPPLAQVEPFIEQYCKRFAGMRQPLTKDQVISLMSDMITGTEHERRYKEWKKKHSHEHKDGERLVGPSWFNGFMKRHPDLKSVQVDTKRTEWRSYDNFAAMYDHIYDRLVEAGVAERLETPIYMNKDGEEVPEEDAFGLPVPIKIIRGDYFLIADECGCNTNQEQDGQIGSEKHIVGVDLQETRRKRATTNLHFTVLPFTSSDGDVVCCAIIMKSEKDASELPMSWKTGVDILSPLHPGGTTREIFEFNSGSETALSGGPVCTFRGKEIPCFISCSPEANITSTILEEILRHIDELSVYDHSVATPVLLVNGRHSRLELPFLDYIHNPRHKWIVCTDTPYATHCRQVADSSQQNGAFKQELVRAKGAFFDAKPGTDKNLSPTDIVPLVKRAWGKSYASRSYCKKAVAEHGWNPCNRALLLHPDIIRTRDAPQQKDTTEPNSPMLSPPRTPFSPESLNLEHGTAV